jgi:hypothetical protein
MIDLPTAEKISNPKLALLVGLLIGLGLGAGAAWTASTTVHDAQFKVLDAVNKDLKRQVAELETANQAKDTEMDRLREQLSELSPQRREAESKRRAELEKFIQRIDKEIAQKREEARKESSRRLIVWRADDPGGQNCRPEDRPKSDAQIQRERELDALTVQRHEARKKLIELTAQ